VLSAFFAVLLFWALRALTVQPMPGEDTPATTVREIGERLFRQYSFAFEATSVLILVAMVGAIILARKEQQ
jgi:NADH-quinone oxidoreductase subunit J